MEVLWSPFVAKFSAFTAEVNGETHQIDSLKKLREVEAQSFRDYEAGKSGDPRFQGARPAVFRQYSRDPGNRTDPIRIVPLPDVTPRRVDRRGRKLEAGISTVSSSSLDE